MLVVAYEVHLTIKRIKIDHYLGVVDLKSSWRLACCWDSTRTTWLHQRPVMHMYGWEHQNNCCCCTCCWMNTNTLDSGNDFAVSQSHGVDALCTRAKSEKIGISFFDVAVCNLVRLQTLQRAPRNYHLVNRWETIQHIHCIIIAKVLDDRNFRTSSIRINIKESYAFTKLRSES